MTLAFVVDKQYSRAEVAAVAGVNPRHASTRADHER